MITGCNVPAPKRSDISDRYLVVKSCYARCTALRAGSGISEVLAANGLQLPVLHLGIPDRFIEHGARDTCLRAAGLDLAGLTASVEKWWALQTQETIRSVRSV